MKSNMQIRLDVSSSVLVSFISFVQLSKPGHESWWVTKFDVKTHAFGPDKAHPAQGHWKQAGEAGRDKFSGPTLLLGKLNLIDGNAATEHFDTILTAS